MDREEYPVAVELGDASAPVCIPEGPSVEPVHGDAVEPASLCDGGATPQPQALISQNELNAEVEPAQVIEALLFASDTPLSAARLAELSGMGSAGQVRVHVAALNEKYAAAGLSFRIEAISRGYQMLTLPAYRPWLVKLNKHRGQTRLSPAALETLSIVAYKQPVIRADVEAIRGVACGEVLNRLREMGLLKIIGRAEIVGRPMLYGTTRKFLDIFGLADLDDLPPMETLTLRRPEPPAEEEEDAAANETPAEIPVVVAGA
ncbi:MAG: SMC-Scp complex subunit ScpB [Phycisphaerae bacterium]|nr:SMC-Scp complex subunit ScpB [Phycisphaerae bacterium]